MSLLGSVRDLAQDHGLWWPEGDPARCHELGDAWLRASAACEQAIEAVDHTVRRVRLDDHGEAIDAFTEHGSRMMTELSREAERLRQVGHVLLDRADQIEDARRRIEAIAAEIAAIVATAAALTIFTAGVSDAMAADATAALLAEGAALEVAMNEAAVALTSRIAAYALMGAWEGGVIDVVAQTTRSFVRHQNPFGAFSTSESLHAVGFGAGFGAVGGTATFVPPLPPGLGMGPEDAERVADAIATGHAWEKHVIKRAEFPGITTPKQFAEHIQEVLEHPSAVRRLEDSRTLYWDERSGTLVLVNPNALDLGSAYVPTRGRTYFDERFTDEVRR